MTGTGMSGTGMSGTGMTGTGMTGTGMSGAAYALPARAGLVEASLVGAGSRRPIASSTGQGLWLVTRAGRVFAFGDAHGYGGAHPSTPVVGAAATPSGDGYWLATSGGGVYSFGDAGHFGSLGGRHLTSPVVGMAATGDGKGYWLATAAGAVYAFGDAVGHGVNAGTILVAPLKSNVTGPAVGIVADPGTGGFWLATARGTVLAYGGAPTYGQADLPSAVVGVAATPDGRGYWLVARDGRTASRGDASRRGALNGAYSWPVVGMAVAPAGRGYWLATSNGRVFAYGAAGSVVPPAGSPSVVAILAAPPSAASGSPGAGTPGGTAGAGALAVATDALPPASVSVPYTAQLAARGGSPPYTWALISGALPPGLALSELGLISGSPAATGNYSFTAEVTDAGATPAHATAQFEMAVGASPVLGQLPVSEEPSTNWSGYVAGSGPYTAASGTFTVPSLSPGAPAQSLVSEWVGIDGAGAGVGSLVQAGVTELPDPTTSLGFDVFAWWEVLPANSQPIMAMTVNPGDEVSVAISQVSGTSWEISVSDGTDGQSYSQEVAYNGPGASAEWIVEAPTDGQTNQQLPLAPYSPTVEFTDLSASGSSTAMSDVVMTQGGQQISTPSALTQAGFDVAYGATAPGPP